MIHKKLLEIQKKSIALKKDADNPFFQSRYITLDSIIQTYNPILTELNIVCMHHTRDGKLVTVLFDTEDETKVESEFSIYNNDPQKQGSEITYGKRYNLGQLLNIQTDLDDDGNVASSEGNTKEFYPDQKEKKWLNYEDLLEIAEAGNTTEKQVSDIITQDGYTLSANAKKAVRHYVETGEIVKDMFFSNNKK